MVCMTFLPPLFIITMPSQTYPFTYCLFKATEYGVPPAAGSRYNLVKLILMPRRTFNIHYGSYMRLRIIYARMPHLRIHVHIYIYIHIHVYIYIYTVIQVSQSALERSLENCVSILVGSVGDWRRSENWILDTRSWTQFSHELRIRQHQRRCSILNQGSKKTGRNTYARQKIRSPKGVP